MPSVASVGRRACRQKPNGKKKNPKTKTIQTKNNSRISNQMSVPDVHQKCTNNPTSRCLLTQLLNVVRAFPLHKTFYNLSFSSSGGVIYINFSLVFLREGLARYETGLKLRCSGWPRNHSDPPAVAWSAGIVDRSHYAPLKVILFSFLLENWLCHLC